MLTRTMISGTGRARGATVFLLGVGLACGEKRAAVSREVQPPASAPSTQTQFRLLTINYVPIPHEVKGEAGECDEMVREGTYTINGEAWSAEDVVERTCPEALAFRLKQPTKWNGYLHRVGDTIAFLTKDSAGTEMELGRGVLRGDTLVTGGEDFGPKRVYVRTKPR